MGRQSLDLCERLDGVRGGVLTRSGVRSRAHRDEPRLYRGDSVDQSILEPLGGVINRLIDLHRFTR